MGKRSSAKPQKAAAKTHTAQAELRVLTFNWSETYTNLLAEVFPNLHVIDRPSLDQSERAWDMRVDSIPPNVRVLHDPDGARKNVLEGMYDIVICHTVRDLEFVKPLPVASVLMAHTALDAELYGEPERVESVRAFLRQLLSARGILLACPSQAKLQSWGISGDVIAPAIDASRYGGWEGDEAAALVVGNDFAKWNHATGYDVIKTALRDVSWTLLGNNPADEQPGLTQLDLQSPNHTRKLYQHHRVFVTANRAPYDDAVSLQMLEAMAYGMPVAILAHPDNPLKDGKDALVGEDAEALGDKIKQLLEDPDLAARIGKRGRTTVQKQFGMGAFAKRWTDFVERAIAHYKVHAPRVAENERIAQEHLAQGVELMREGHLQEAEAAFVAAAHEAPDSPGPTCNLGAYYLNQGRLVEARQYLEQSLFTDPYFMPALLNLARVNLLEEVPQAAQPLLGAAVSVDPDDLSAAALLAMTYLALGSAEEAREVLSGLERRGAPDEMILPLLAQAHRETRDFGKALEAARRWISLDPGNSDAFRELSQTLLLQGNFDEAHEALARAIELEARN